MDGSKLGEQARYTWQPLTSDGSIDARITSRLRRGADKDAKAGIMLRQGLGPSAPYYFVFVTERGDIHVQYKLSRDATSVRGARTRGNRPIYLRAVRLGDAYHAYASINGVTWDSIDQSGVILHVHGVMLVGVAVVGLADSATVCKTITVHPGQTITRLTAHSGLLR